MATLQLFITLISACFKSVFVATCSISFFMTILFITNVNLSESDIWAGNAAASTREAMGHTETY
eukprot:8504039-Pyramimonas_sp.AAC.1